MINVRNSVALDIANQVVPVKNAKNGSPPQLTRKRSREEGIVVVDEPATPKKKKIAEATGEKCSAKQLFSLLVDESGAFDKQKADVDKLMKSTGWKKTSLYNAIRAAKNGTVYNDQKGRRKILDDEMLKEAGEKISRTPLVKSDVTACLNKMAYNKSINNGTSFQPLSPNTIRSCHKRMNLVERASNDCNSEARKIAAACPYTYITTAVAHAALAQLYGVPQTATMNDSITDSAAPQYVLRGENIWFYDESVGRTLEISNKVMIRKGTKHVTLQVNKCPLRQQFFFIFGCNAVGEILPVLIGLKSEKIPVGKPIRIELPQFRYLFVGNSNSVVILYNPKDKIQLPKIFKEEILDPVLTDLSSNLFENERQIVFQDGGCDQHLNPIIEPLYLVEMEEKRRVEMKTHVNATGKTSLCDLIAIFKLIKSPDALIKQCSYEQIQYYTKNMTVLNIISSNS